MYYCGERSLLLSKKFLWHELCHTVVCHGPLWNGMELYGIHGTRSPNGVFSILTPFSCRICSPIHISMNLNMQLKIRLSGRCTTFNGTHITLFASRIQFQKLQLISINKRITLVHRSQKAETFQVRNSNALMSLVRQDHLIEMNTRLSIRHMEIVCVRMSSTALSHEQFNILVKYFLVLLFLLCCCIFVRKIISRFNAHLINTSSRSLHTMNTVNENGPNETELIISTSAVSLRVLVSLSVV